MQKWTINQRIDLSMPNKIDSKIAARLVVGDNKAHGWSVSVYDGSSEVNVTSASVSAYFNRPDGKAVMVKGTAQNNVATVTLPSECYAFPGVMTGIMKITSTDASVATMAVSRFIVESGAFGEIVDPGDVVPNLDELLAQLAKLESAIQAAESVRADADAGKFDGAPGAQGEPGKDAPQINDNAINATNPWSSAKIVETVCSPFSESGEIVACTPIDNYPLKLGVKTITKKRYPKNRFVRVPTKSSAIISTTTAEDGRVTLNGTSSDSIWSIDSFGTNTSDKPLFTVSQKTSITLSGGSEHVSVAVQYLSGGYNRGTKYTSGTSSTTFELPADSSIVRTYLRVEAGVTVNNEVVSPQLEIGSTATAYEPYSTAAAIAGTDSIEINAIGKNFLKIPDAPSTVGGVTYTPQADGSLIANGTCSGQDTFAIYQGVLPPGKYTISGGASGLQVALAIYKQNGTHSKTVCYSENGKSATGDVPALSGDEAYFKGFIQALPSTVGNRLDNVVIKPQLELGLVATGLEPHRDLGTRTVTPTATMYGVSGAEDSVEIDESGNVIETHRTVVKAFDGTENWQNYKLSGIDTIVNFIAIDDILPATSESVPPHIICSHYETIPYRTLYAGNTTGVSNSVGSKNVSFVDKSLVQTDSTEWKAYLAAQHAAGTPVTVVYELAQPTTETPSAVAPIIGANGVNTFYSNANSITVGGIADPKWTIKTLSDRIAALEKLAIGG